MTEVTAPAPVGQGSAPATSSAALATPAAPAAPPTPTSATIAPPPAPAGPTAAIPWLEGADETTLGFAKNMNWESPSDVIKSYQDARKFISAPMDKRLVVPGENADPKEWQAVYDRLGRPTGPDGYKADIPAHIPKEVVAATLAKYHELGLTKTQGDAMLAFEIDRSVASQNATVVDKAAKFAAEDSAVKTDWGQAYTQNLAAAQAAARGLGLDSATIDKMSEGIGHKATMQLLAKIGSKMGEPDFVAGDNTERFSAALTPGQAKSTIQERMADQEFVKQYKNGNKAARDEMARLHQYAYPE